MVSSAYRTTILQVAAPDEMRGRLQGVFIVVVAGGPRAGDFLAGSVATGTGERLALVLGGLACVVGVLTASALSRRFLRYDARASDAVTPDRRVGMITSFGDEVDGCRTQSSGTVKEYPTQNSRT